MFQIEFQHILLFLPPVSARQSLVRLILPFCGDVAWNSNFFAGLIDYHKTKLFVKFELIASTVASIAGETKIVWCNFCSKMPIFGYLRHGLTTNDQEIAGFHYCFTRRIYRGVICAREQASTVT